MLRGVCWSPRAFEDNKEVATCPWRRPYTNRNRTRCIRTSVNCGGMETSDYAIIIPGIIVNWHGSHVEGFGSRLM